MGACALEAKRQEAAQIAIQGDQALLANATKTCFVFYKKI